MPLSHANPTSFKKGHTGYKGMLGKTHSPEARKKISEAHKGKSTWNKGMKFPGKLSNSWKGGVSLDKEYIRTRHHKQKNQKRLKLLEFLGNRCTKCGFDDWRALQIDHLNGGGNKEGKNLGLAKMYQRVYSYPKEYQLLCANCNWIKKHENNEWPNKVV